MVHHYICCFVIATITAAVSAVDLFTSIAALEPLADAENVAAHRMDEYISMEMKRIDNLRTIAQGFSKECKGAKVPGTLKELARNRLNLFRLMKRLVVDSKTIIEQMNITNADDFMNNITVLPTETDLRGATDALFRLQDVYRLTATDMANGKVQGSHANERLTARDAFEIGKQAAVADDDYHAVFWLEEALSRLRQEAERPSVEEADVLDFLQYSLSQQGNTLMAYKATKRLVALRPEDDTAVDNLKWYTEDLKVEGLKPTDKPGKLVNPRPKSYDVEERENFEALCRGEKPLPESVIKTLYCYYKSDRPYLRYAPIKVEILHYKPFVAIFRQVLSTRETGIIQSLATPRLKRATVFNRATRELEHASYRITKSAWLKSEDHEAIERINQRLEDMTNLDQSTAELFQVANYGLGGHYEPHWDHAQREEGDPFRDGNRNRVATVLFYLNAPLSGGATVFVNLDLTLFPQRNDALFWYNIKPSGEGDKRTRHAACPVLAGKKWVSNKWIHERNQEGRRPCKLDFDAEDYKIDFYE